MTNTTFTHPVATRFFLSPRFGAALAGQAGSDAARELFWFILPILAVTSFQASASQMGYLFVFRDVPVMLFSLFAGVALDRTSIRKLIVGACAGFGVLLLLAPILLSSEARSITWLYGFAFAVGGLAVLLDVGSTTLLPKLVERHELVMANSRMMIARSSTGILMPALGGLLTRVLAPAIALVFGAALCLGAGFAYWKLPEEERGESKDHKVTFASVLADIRQGFAVLFEVRVLRAVIISSCAGAYGFGAGFALLVFSLSRDLGLEPFLVGLIVAGASVGNLCGSILCSRITAMMGEGRAMLAGNFLAGLGYAGLALALVLSSLPVAIASVVVTGFAAPIFAINQISIRQAITPHHLMGRANATRRFIVFSFLPLGALSAGWLADALSTSAGLLVGTAGMFLATLIGLCSPLRQRKISGVTASPS